MKKLFVILACLVVMAGWSITHFTTSAQKDDKPPQQASFISSNVVISQIFGGGGLANSPFNHDYVELFNRGTSPINLSNWSVQYASATGSNWLPASPLPNFDLQPGQYFLIQFDTNGTVGASLPTPDFVATVLQPEGFIPNLSSTTGKVALVNSSTRLPASTCPSDPSMIDLLGYGSGASCFESVTAAPATSTTALKRNSNGCSDTDNNSADFSVVTPAPRNSSSPRQSCDFSDQLQAGLTADPTTVSPGGTTLLRVTVIPATSPPSTSITVAADLDPIGGPATQPFYDDGTHGDVTAADNVFSYLATVAPGTSGGTAPIVGTAADQQNRTAPVQVTLTISAPLPNEDPLILGNPSGATADVTNENNYLMAKPQYTLSYNRSKATPNWVAWRLDSSWIGSTQRQDDYRPDPALPAGWYQVQDADYSGSGYDRGHMCPSGDRTNSVANNSATFLMTNFVPQLSANNQGPWEDFESYCRTLASQGNELYIFDGPSGTQGTIAGGKIVVPQYTWKVVLVLPNGSDDLHRISKGTRVFGVIIPNFAPVDINAPWRNFRVTVNQVEYLSGYDFFNQIPKNTQEIIERRRDNQ
jgi:DNA/RNA endonuclease G (NUC1)